MLAALRSSWTNRPRPWSDWPGHAKCATLAHAERGVVVPQFLARRFPDPRMKRSMAARQTIITLSTKIVAAHRSQLASSSGQKALLPGGSDMHDGQLSMCLECGIRLLSCACLPACRWSQELFW